LPIGGAKGGALALMIEVLAAAVAGGAWGWEASSFFDDRGGPPDMAHLLIALDPHRLSGGAYASRMAGLLAAFATDTTARLPGTRRLGSREQAIRDGIDVPAALHTEIAALCAVH
jgi:(2R)-3-sulfolactate dehydrogenase (NADP+)